MKRFSMVALCMLFCLAGLVQAQQAPLRYKFEAGSKTQYVMEQKQKMDMSVAGQEMQMETNNTMDIIMTVESVDSSAGTAKIKYRIERVKMKMSGGPFGTMEFDTNSKEEPEGMMAMMAGPMRAMTKGDCLMTMTNQGEIKDFKLPEAFMKAMEEIPGGGQMSNMSPDMMKQMMNSGMLTLPKEAPSPGHSWDAKVEMKMPFGLMKNVTTYKYAGQESKDGKSLDKIEMKTDSKMESDENAQMQMKMTTKDSKGSILFDNAKGRMHSYDQKLNMIMEMQAGEIKMEQTMSMKVKQ